MTADAAPMTIALTGTGPGADAWARALRGVDGVEIERLSAPLDESLADAFTEDDVAAVAFAAPTTDLTRDVKRALLAGRHVFVAAPVAMRAGELVALEALAKRRQRLLLFDTPALADERIAFIRKMTGGPQPLWRPRYLRALRTGTDGDASLDEAAIAEVAAVLAVVGGAPARVSAFAPRVDDESGAAGVAMLTVAFEGGPLARIDISLVEPWPRREMAIVCDGRTVVLDALDARAPLQIHAANRHRGPEAGGWAETVSEHPVCDVEDRAARVASSFVSAARARDASAGNALDLGRGGGGLGEGPGVNERRRRAAGPGRGCRADGAAYASGHPRRRSPRRGDTATPHVAALQLEDVDRGLARRRQSGRVSSTDVDQV